MSWGVPPFGNDFLALEGRESERESSDGTLLFVERDHADRSTLALL